MEGTTEGRQERGFTATSAVKGREGQRSEPRSLAPAGVEVNAEPDVAAAIAEVHRYTEQYTCPSQHQNARSLIMSVIESLRRRNVRAIISLTNHTQALLVMAAQ